MSKTPEIVTTYAAIDSPGKRIVSVHGFTLSHRIILRDPGQSPVVEKSIFTKDHLGLLLYNLKLTQFPLHLEKPLDFSALETDLCASEVDIPSTKIPNIPIPKTSPVKSTTKRTRSNDSDSESDSDDQHSDVNSHDIRNSGSSKNNSSTSRKVVVRSKDGDMSSKKKKVSTSKKKTKIDEKKKTSTEKLSKTSPKITRSPLEDPAKDFNSVAAVNSVRAEHGLQPVNEQLESSTTSKKKSDDMAMEISDQEDDNNENSLKIFGPTKSSEKEAHSDVEFSEKNSNVLSENGNSPADVTLRTNVGLENSERIDDESQNSTENSGFLDSGNAAVANCSQKESSTTSLDETQLSQNSSTRMIYLQLNNFLYNFLLHIYIIYISTKYLF